MVGFPKTSGPLTDSTSGRSCTTFAPALFPVPCPGPIPLSLSSMWTYGGPHHSLWKTNAKLAGTCLLQACILLTILSSLLTVSLLGVVENIPLASNRPTPEPSGKYFGLSPPFIDFNTLLEPIGGDFDDDQMSAESRDREATPDFSPSDSPISRAVSRGKFHYCFSYNYLTFIRRILSFAFLWYHGRPGHAFTYAYGPWVR